MAEVLGALTLGFMIVGGIVGGVSQFFEDTAAETQYNNAQNALNAEHDYLLGDDDDVGLLAKQFSLQKNEAIRTANLQDKETTQGENTLSTNANLALSQVSLQNLQFGEQLTSENMALGQQYGAQLSGLSQSGTRGSSLEQAVDMQKAVNRAQIDATADINNKSTDLSLKNILSNFGNGIFQVQTARDNANYLRNSYEEGGAAYESYMLERDQTAHNIQAQKDVNEAEWNIYSDKGNTIMRYLNSIFGGANSGMQFGYKLGTVGQDAGWWDSSNFKGQSFNDLGGTN